MKRVYSKTQHTFFDELITMLISLRSFGLAADIHSHGHARGLSFKRRAIALGGLTVPIDLKFYPYTSLRMLAANRWPSKITLHEKPLGSSMPRNVGVVLRSRHVKTVTTLLTQAVFIRYFETHRPSVEATYGNTSGWPAVWNFARAIRNAFAHGGNIHFRSHEPNVSWRGLTYGVSDNGRQIFHVDIAYVEIILLMEEMDAAL
jgi:hypothetical protein